jgi:hypothetical protein
MADISHTAFSDALQKDLSGDDHVVEAASLYEAVLLEPYAPLDAYLIISLSCTGYAPTPASRFVARFSITPQNVMGNFYRKQPSVLTIQPKFNSGVSTAISSA